MDMANYDKIHGLSKNLRIIPVDLQLFGGEKTEQASSKKRRDARNKGQVVQSKDLASAISLLTVFLA